MRGLKVADRIHLVGSGLLGMNQSNEWDCNVYLLNGGDCLMLVDCGAGIDPDSIIEHIVSDEFEPRRIQYIFVTHGHADHSGGAYWLQQVTGANVICSETTAQILENADTRAISLPAAKRAGTYPKDYIYHGCPVSVRVKEGDVFKVGDLSLQFLSTPGHSKDSFSCYVPELKALFSGDVVFEGGRIAALSTPDFSIQELSATMAELTKLPVEALLPGHLCPIVRNGRTVIEKAQQSFERLNVPPSII